MLTIKDVESLVQGSTAIKAEMDWTPGLSCSLPRNCIRLQPDKCQHRGLSRASEECRAENVVKRASGIKGGFSEAVTFTGGLEPWVGVHQTPCSADTKVS